MVHGTAEKTVIFIPAEVQWIEINNGSAIYLEIGNDTDSEYLPRLAQQLAGMGWEVERRLRNARPMLIVGCDCGFLVKQDVQNFISLTRYEGVVSQAEIDLRVDPTIANQKEFPIALSDGDVSSGMLLDIVPHARDYLELTWGRSVESDFIKSDDLDYAPIRSNVSQEKDVVGQSVQTIGILRDDGSGVETNTPQRCSLERMFIGDDSSTYTKQITLEFDLDGRINQTNASRIIHALIARGQLAEAHQAVRLLEETPATTILRRKIEFMLYGSFEGAIDEMYEPSCKEMLSFWYLLSDDVGPKEPHRLRTGLMQYKALSRDLQIVLFDQVKARLQDGDLFEEFSDFARVMRLESQDSQDGDEEPRLSQILGRSIRGNPAHIVQALEVTTKAELAEVMSLAASIRVQNRGTSIWEEILISEVRAHLRFRMYLAALGKIRVLENGELKRILLAEFVDGLLGMGSERDILIAFQSSDFQLFAEVDQVRIKSRISDLGFSALLAEQSQHPRFDQISRGFYVGFENANEINPFTSDSIVRKAASSILAGSGDFQNSILETLSAR